MTGYELKQHREKLGLSQQELAIRLNGLAVSTIARWEQLKEKEIDNKLLEISMEVLDARVVVKPRAMREALDLIQDITLYFERKYKEQLPDEVRRAFDLILSITKHKYYAGNVDDNKFIQKIRENLDSD
jgi:transcriptional regulator with XRE-family HTH domain